MQKKPWSKELKNRKLEIIQGKSFKIAASYPSLQRGGRADVESAIEGSRKGLEVEDSRTRHRGGAAGPERRRRRSSPQCSPLRPKATWIIWLLASFLQRPPSCSAQVSDNYLNAVSSVQLRRDCRTNGSDLSRCQHVLSRSGRVYSKRREARKEPPDPRPDQSISTTPP